MGIYDRGSRRLFLRAAGGGLIGIPLLHSLVPRDVRAAGAPPRLRYIQMVTLGGRHSRPWYGELGKGEMKRVDQDTWTQPLSAVAGPISEIIGAPFDGLRKKLTILRGLDTLGANETHSGGCATTCSTSGFNASAEADCKLSADHVIANSSATYPMGTPVGGTRHLAINPVRDPSAEADGNFTFTFAKGKTYYCQTKPSAVLRQAFGIIAGTTPTGGAAPVDPRAARLKLVDRARADAEAISKSSRISQADRATLGNFMDLLADIQTSLEPSTSATKVAIPDARDDEVGYEARFKRMADIVTAALAAGNTNVAHFSIQEHLPFDKNWHDYCDHSAPSTTDPNTLLYNKNCVWHSGMAAYLMNKLDAIQDGNGTLLDNSVFYYTSQFSGFGGHMMYDLPVLVAGSAGGKLSTGNFIDYRERDTNGVLVPKAWLGRPHNDFFTTVFQAFGIPGNEYRLPTNTQGGFGNYSKRYSATKYTKYVDNGIDRAKNKLPGFWIG